MAETWWLYHFMPKKILTFPIWWQNSTNWHVSRKKIEPKSMSICHIGLRSTIKYLQENYSVCQNTIVCESNKNFGTRLPGLYSKFCNSCCCYLCDLGQGQHLTSLSFSVSTCFKVFMDGKSVCIWYKVNDTIKWVLINISWD